MFTTTTRRIEKFKDDIITDYQNGNSLKSLSKKYNVDKRNIKKLLIDNGIEIRNMSHEPYNIDETYFDEINTPNKAYVLGILYADGCNTRGNKVKLSLQDSDIDILLKIRKELKMDKHIGHYDRKNEKHKNVAELVIYNKHISEQLAKLGCVPRKSLILQFPNFLPKELMSHFLRGYFDGDGHLDRVGRGYHVSFVSSMDFCVGLHNFLNELCIENRICSVPTNEKSGRIVIGKKVESKKILDYMYKDADIYMDRKYELYIEKFYKDKKAN